MKTKISIIILLSFLCPDVYSQPDIEVKSCIEQQENIEDSLADEMKKYNHIKKCFIEKNGDLKIKEFTISGLEKTEKSVVMEMAKTRKGDPLSAFDADNLVQELRKSGVIKDVRIDYTNTMDSVLVSIDIKEKISLIPIPMVISNSSSFSAGLFLIESNLFGLNKKLFLGGIFGTAGWLAMIGYTDPSFLDSKFTGGIYFNAGYKELENSDMDGDVYKKYNRTKTISKISGGYRFSREFTLLLTSAFYYADVEKDEKLSYDFTGETKSVNPGIKFRYDSMHHTGLFKYGFQAEGEFEYGFSSIKQYYTFYGKSQYSIRLFKKHLAAFKINGGVADAPDVLIKRIGGKPGFKTLPAEKIVSNKYISSTAMYELPVLKISWVTFTILGFFEGGTYQDETEEYKNFYGPGTGMRMYLKDIALPALGFDYAYNIETSGHEISAAVGMTM